MEFSLNTFDLNFFKTNDFEIENIFYITAVADFIPKSQSKPTRYNLVLIGREVKTKRIFYREYKLDIYHVPNRRSKKSNFIKRYPIPVNQIDEIMTNDLPTLFLDLIKKNNFFQTEMKLKTIKILPVEHYLSVSTVVNNQEGYFNLTPTQIKIQFPNINPSYTQFNNLARIYSYLLSSKFI